MSQIDFPVEAYQRLVRDVYAPVFFTKLARDYGWAPQSDEDRQQALELAGMLRRAEEEEMAKQAASFNRATLINEATDGMKSEMARRGHPTMPSSREAAMAKVAAQAVEQDEGLVNAALEFGNYLSMING
jgi:hypothetical protein